MMARIVQWAHKEVSSSAIPYCEHETDLEAVSGGTEEGFTYAYQSGQITPGLVVTCNTAQNTCVTTTHGEGISVSIGRGLVGDV